MNINPAPNQARAKMDDMPIAWMFIANKATKVKSISKQAEKPKIKTNERYNWMAKLQPETSWTR